MAELDPDHVRSTMIEKLGEEPPSPRTPVVQRPAPARTISEPVKRGGPKPKTYEYNGEMVTLRDLAARAGIPKNTLWARIVDRGWTVERAVSEPPRRARRLAAEAHEPEPLETDP